MESYSVSIASSTPTPSNPQVLILPSHYHSMPLLSNQPSQTKANTSNPHTLFPFVMNSDYCESVGSFLTTVPIEYFNTGASSLLSVKYPSMSVTSLHHSLSTIIGTQFLMSMMFWRIHVTPIPLPFESGMCLLDDIEMTSWRDTIALSEAYHNGGVDIELIRMEER